MDMTSFEKIWKYIQNVGGRVLLLNQVINKYYIAPNMPIIYRVVYYLEENKYFESDVPRLDVLNWTGMPSVSGEKLYMFTSSRIGLQNTRIMPISYTIQRTKLLCKSIAKHKN